MELVAIAANYSKSQIAFVKIDFGLGEKGKVLKGYDILVFSCASLKSLTYFIICCSFVFVP